jgi:hypothetical protein
MNLKFIIYRVNKEWQKLAGPSQNIGSVWFYGKKEGGKKITKTSE